MRTFVRILQFLRLADPDGSLSLTSVTLALALWKFAVSPLETEVLVALLGAATAYSAKKVIRGKAVKDETTEQVAALEAKVKALTEQVVIVNNRTNPANVRR
jgi:hypothetical protein